MLKTMRKKAAITSLDASREFRPELFRVYAGQSSNLAADESRQVLNGYLSYLESELTSQNFSVDIGKSQEMLLEVSQFIHTGSARVGSDVYRCVLRRLTGIYAKGLAVTAESAYSLTASDYADVIESISRVYPAYDYSEIVGQLIHYMNQLFKLRKNSWKTVYEHILSMPDSIEAMQLLRNEHFFAVQQWAEEGVENLFHIQDDLHNRVRLLDEQISGIQQKITETECWMGERQRVLAALDVANLVDLKLRRAVHESRELSHTRERLIMEREGKAHIIDLIESNILEFEDKLKETRRAFSIRLVYTAS